MSRIERRFLGSEGGPAAAAAQALIACALRDGGRFDLGGWIVAVPGARAGRLLLAELLRAAERAQGPLELPTIVTPGVLVEHLVAPPPDAPAAATDLERRAAWAAALAAASRPLAAALGHPTGIDTASAWRLAAELLRTEDALDAGDRGWRDAALATARIGADTTRIDALAELSDEAEERLAAAGLASPRVARAARLRSGRPLGRTVALVGVLELGPALERALAYAERVLVLVVGEPSHADRFDPLGRPTEGWRDVEFPIADDRVAVADTPYDQAAAALTRFAQASVLRGGVLPCDDAAIGLADPSLDAALVAAGRDAGVAIHVASGVSVAATRVGRTIAALARVAERGDADAWAALLRRPILAGRPDCGEPRLVGALDRLRSRCVPMDVAVPIGEPELAADAELVSAAMRSVEAMLAPLAQGVAGLPAVVAALAEAAEGADADDCDRAILDVAGDLAAELAALAQAPPSLRPELDAGAAFALFAEELASASVPMQPRERSIEALGWLELLFEPASELVVLGMNEGCVPGGGADPLLPEAVRRALGLATASVRALRDAAILDAIARRAPNACFIAGRRGVDGEPLAPSRLLFATSDERLAERTLLLCDGDRAERYAPRAALATAARSRFVVPEPDDRVRERTHMAVTDFRIFLASPLRWWLERVEGLREVEDDPRELPLPTLGTHLHRAIEEAARDGELTTIRTPEALSRRIAARLDARLRDEIGSRPPAAIRLQRQGLAPRIAAFARWQIASAAEGWEIDSVERPLPDSAEIVAPGHAPMRLRGVVDRIDRHPERCAWRLIDYKTSDRGLGPRETHLTRRGVWTDLQLPLYVHALRPLLEAAMPGATVDVGYVRLSADDALAGWVSAEFSGDELRAAVDAAREVVKAIREGRFEEGRPLAAEDPFAWILQTPVLMRAGDEEAES
jgi:hypothetical protein